MDEVRSYTEEFMLLERMIKETLTVAIQRGAKDGYNAPGDSVQHTSYWRFVDKLPSTVCVGAGVERYR